MRSRRSVVNGGDNYDILTTHSRHEAPGHYISSVMDGRQRAAPAGDRTRLLDVLLLAAVFLATFVKAGWIVAGADVALFDVAAALFCAAFVADRVGRRDYRFPRTAAALAVFFGVFLLVYLIGFFNLETIQERSLFSKGLALFVLHFSFVVAAVAHLSVRGERFYWQTLGSFAGGMAVNGGYGLLELAYAKATGGQLDQIVLAPFSSELQARINLFGQVGGESVYRVNAMTGDPNHLGIMLAVPILVLLPLYLRLERAHRLRTPLAVLLGFLFAVALATLSRSGLLAIAAGLLVLAVPYRRFLFSARLLVPAGAVAAALGFIVLRRLDFFETVFQARTGLTGSGVQTHLGFYELVPPLLDEHLVFGRGINTFSAYYEFVTGESNYGPHSYYVAVLADTGLVGAIVFLAYLKFIFGRLAAVRRLGRALAGMGDAAAARVRPLGWGLSAALVGTLAANVFYLTMHMFYFFVFAAVALAAPVVFSRSRGRAVSAP